MNNNQETKNIDAKQTHLSDMSMITKGAGITLSGTIVGKAFIFLLTVYLARSLGASNVGIYFLGVTIVHTMAIFAVAGLNVGMVRYVAIYRGRGDDRRLKGAVLFAAVVSFLIGLAMVGIVYLSGEWAATKLFNKPALREALYWLVISIPFECLMRVFLSATRGLKHMHYTAIIENWSWTGLRLLLAIVLISGFGMGLKGAFMAFLISSVVTATLALIAAARVMPLLDRSVKPIYEAGEILRFSLPMLFTALIYDLVSHLDILMLGLFVSASDVGIYSVAVRIVQLGQVVFMAFQPIFQPFVAELNDKKEHDRLQKLLQALTHWSVMLSLPVFLSLLVFPEFFLSFFGNGFVPGAKSLSILAASLVFSTLSNLPAAILFMSGRSDLSLINNLTVLLINAILNYLLIPIFGIVGAAMATGTSYLVLCIIRIVEVYTVMGIQPFHYQIWKPFTAGLVVTTVLILIRLSGWANGLLGSFFLVCISLISYFSLVIMLRIDDQQTQIGNMIWKKFSGFMR
ncbi:flippase [Desulfosarcina ovata]|nr:flippase [Desulfosarcina ovata]